MFKNGVLGRLNVELGSAFTMETPSGMLVLLTMATYVLDHVNLPKTSSSWSSRSNGFKFLGVGGMVMRIFLALMIFSPVGVLTVRVV